MLQGMVFVWGSASPNAALESEAKPVPGIPEMEQSRETPRMTVDGRRAFTTLPVRVLLPMMSLLLPYVLGCASKC